MSLTLVGDPAQSIFSWRSAKPNLFLNYNNLFPGKVKQYTILKNYRTPKQLVEIANEFRKLFEDNGIKYTPSDPHLPTMPDVLEIRDFDIPEQEINDILREIKRIHEEEKIPYSKFSILCRRNEDLTMFESGVVSLGIPYYFKFDSQSLMQQSGFKFLYALYTLMLDPTNILAFCELISPIKGVGVKFLDKIKPLYKRDISTLDFFSDKNQNNIPGSKTKQWGYIFQFVRNFLTPIVNLAGKEISFTTLNKTILQGLNNTIIFEEESYDAKKIGYALKRPQMIETFNTLSTLYSVSCEDNRFQKMSLWEQFQEIYENLQLSQDVHNEIKEQNRTLPKEQRQKKEDRDALGFFTVHSYKGKENDYIYYAMVNGTWQLDFFDFESKCVFYVAITRSKRKLTISGSNLIRGYDGTMKRAYVNPFVEHIRRIVEKR